MKAHPEIESGAMALEVRAVRFHATGDSGVLCLEAAQEDQPGDGEALVA